MGLCLIILDDNKARGSDFFSQFIKRLPQYCRDQFTVFTFVVAQLFENKRSKRANITDLVKIFKEFLLVCVSIVPKACESAPQLVELYREILNKLIDAAESSFIDHSDKASRDIYMVENLYYLHACLTEVQTPALSEDRKRIKLQYTQEIHNFVHTSVLSPFGKLLHFLSEIDNKLAASVAEYNIQAFVYNNRHEYKKFSKEFNIKNVKKNIERMHKVAKKSFKDIALYTTAWTIMGQETMSQINKIQSYVKTYGVRVPEMALDFETDDIVQFVKSLDKPF